MVCWPDNGATLPFRQPESVRRGRTAHSRAEPNCSTYVSVSTQIPVFDHIAHTLEVAKAAIMSSVIRPCQGTQIPRFLLSNKNLICHGSWSTI